MIDLNRVIESYLVLSTQIKKDLDEQFMNNRIKGTDYANVYSALMGTVLQLAFQAPEKDALVCKVKAETENIARATARTEDDLLNTLLNTQYTAWAEAFKSGKVDDMPGVLVDDSISSLYKTLLDRIQNSAWRDKVLTCYVEDTTQGITSVNTEEQTDE